MGWFVFEGRLVRVNHQEKHLISREKEKERKEKKRNEKKRKGQKEKPTPIPVNLRIGLLPSPTITLLGNGFFKSGFKNPNSQYLCIEIKVRSQRKQITVVA